MLPGARFTMPLILVMALTIVGLAITIPQRTPGNPSFDKLMHNMVLSFQNGVASLKMILGKGVP